MRKPNESVIRGKRMNFYLAEIQIKRLKSISKKTGLSASEILRRAVDEYWERFEKKGKSRSFL
jgi:predicted DNA-binding protein